MGEIAFERAAVEWAEDRGWLVRKMQYIGRNGCPDRFFFGDGRVVIIEFKAPNGRPSLQQEREVARLLRRGIRVFYVRNQEELEEALADEDSC